HLAPLFLYYSAAHRALPSFPTRRSSDLRYFSIVENRRMGSDQTVQRTVLYLGEINDQQQAAWRKTLAVFDEQQQHYTNLSLFPEDRKSTRLNSSHVAISYAVFCLKKKK